MKATKRKTSVRDYIQACKVLRQETQLARDDLQARSEGVEIRYLADFSEVFAFAFPRQQQTLRPMRVFGDEDALTTELLQRDALHNLFFRGGTPPIILPSHAVELRTQLARLRAGTFDRLINEMLEAARAIERAASTKEVRDLVAKVESPGDLTPDEWKEAFEVFERHARALMLVHQHGDGQPHDKIMRLVQEGRLLPLSGEQKTLQPDPATRDRWYIKIRDRRLSRLEPQFVEERRAEISERSHIDASAVGMLYALNRLSPRVRYLFVSRSSHMHEIFQEEKRSWDVDVFRHPRSFTSLFLRHEPADIGEWPPSDTLKKEWGERQEQLDSQWTNLDLFIAATDSQPADVLENDPLFREKIQKFRQDWELSRVLAASATGEVVTVQAERTQEKKRRVMDAVRLLTEHDAFSEILENRLNELANGLERGHDSSAFYALSSNTDGNDDLENAIRTELGRNQVLLVSRRYWVPHTLQFTSPELTQWAKALDQKREIDRTHIFEFMVENFSRQAEYERLLAMAYLMASIKKWDFAERFCRRALSLPDPPLTEAARAQILRYEAHFFLAVCLRVYQPSPKRYREALTHHLQYASDLRQQRPPVKKNAKTHDDPRYLIERGNLIYKWNQEDPSKEPRPTLPIGAALECWTQALAAAQGNAPLQAQIHNNICFYYCDAVPEHERDLAKIRTHLDQMTKEQCTIDRDSQHWPPVFLDTMALARHILYLHTRNTADLAGLRTAAADLRWAYEHADLLEVHKISFGERLAAIEKTLKAVPPTAHPPDAHA